MNEYVVLVDEDDNELGAIEKLHAHLAPGHLHRAISVFILDDQGAVLLQRRAGAKYHFAGRWSNTCCSHPRPGEDAVDAGRRRLREEMGIEAELREVGTFIYRAEDAASGLIEHELDHVLVGRWNGSPSPNPDEADAWRWVEMSTLHAEMARDADEFTPWLAPALQCLGSV